MRATDRPAPFVAGGRVSISKAQAPIARPAAKPTTAAPPAAPEAPTSTAGDRARLAAGPFSPVIAGFAEVIGLADRRAALHAGRPGVEDAERGKLMAALGRLDKAQLLALRKALVEQPPHPELKKMRGHPSISGPPTARGILAILSGEPLGLAPAAKSVVDQLFAPGTVVELDGVAHTIRGRGYPDRAGEAKVVLSSAGGVLQLGAKSLLERAPALLDRVQGMDLKGVTESDLVGGAAVIDHAPAIFAPGRAIVFEGARGAIASRDADTGKVTVEVRGRRREVEPEALLVENPRLIPIGASLFAEQGGAVTHGFRVGEVQDVPGKVRLAGPSGPVELPVELVLAHNRAGLLGPAAAGRSPIAAFAPGAGPVSPSEAAEALWALDAAYARVADGTAALYRAAEHAPATVRRRIDDFAAEAGQTLQAIRGLHERLLLDRDLGRTPPSRDEVRAALARSLAAPTTLAATAPYSKSKLLGTLAKARPAEPLPFAGAEGLRAHLDDAVRPTVLAAVDPKLRAFARPFFYADEALVRSPAGRRATPSESAAIAAELAADERLASGHLDTGCYARAQVVAERLEAAGLFAAKLFVEDELHPLRATKGDRTVEWDYHVATVTLEATEPGQGARLVVIDPALSPTPLPVADWVARFLGPENGAAEFVLTPTNVYGPKDRPADRAALLTESWRKLAELAELERRSKV